MNIRMFSPNNTNQILQISSLSEFSMVIWLFYCWPVVLFMFHFGRRIAVAESKTLNIRGFRV